VALVGSMAGTKTTDLIAAAKTFTTLVVWTTQSHYYFQGWRWCPYSMVVNVGKLRRQGARSCQRSDGDHSRHNRPTP